MVYFIDFFSLLTEMHVHRQSQMLKLIYLFLLISFPSQYLLFVLSIRSLVTALF